MRIVVWGVYDLGKPRPRILLAGLEDAGVEVVHCNAPIWAGVEDKSQVRGLWRRLSFALRWLLAYPGLLWRYLRAPRHDAVLVGYPGILDVLVLAPFARARGAALVWDVFLPLWETVVEDRRLLPPDSMAARCLAALERFAARRADRLVLDTRAHAEAFASYLAGPRDHPAPPVEAVFVGAEEAFHPEVAAAEKVFDDTFSHHVLFYGQMIPLHGIATLLEASRLTPPEIGWTLVGRGQDEALVEHAVAQGTEHGNLRWVPWVPYGELPRWIRRADVCLGIFGETTKAARVIPNKVFQVLAVGRPLVTRGSPAIRELIDDDAPGVELVPAGDAQALAAAVIRLLGDGALTPQPPLPGGEGEPELLRERFSRAQIGLEMRGILERAIRSRRWTGA